MAETEVKTEVGGAPSALEKKVARQVEVQTKFFINLQIIHPLGNCIQSRFYVLVLASQDPKVVFHKTVCCHPHLKACYCTVTLVSVGCI